jgi:phosphopantetheinyl transferase
MARRIMSPAEFEAWSGTPAGDQLAAFFRIWTAKEAVAKLDGRGLQVTFSQVAFDTSLVRSKPMSTTCQAAWPKGHKLHQCWLHWLIDDPAIVATLATTDPLAIDMVECRRWNGSI